MQIVVARPPNYDEIVAKFPFAANGGVIFTYGRTIYNPSAVAISGALKSHEAVHADRQGEDVDGWWRRYLADPVFRLEEELLAHRAEYRSTKTFILDPNARARELQRIAERLGGPLYNQAISVALARRLISVDVDRKKVSKLLREQEALV